MKFEKNNRYFTIALYVFAVIAASILFLFILLDPKKMLSGVNKFISILSPVIIGFVLAFILNPVLNFFERVLFKKAFNDKKQAKLKRAISMICTYIFFLGLLTLFVVLIVPSLIESITDLVKNIRGYYTKGIALIEDILARFNISSEFLAPFNDIGNKLVELVIETMNALLPKLGAFAVSATSVVKNLVIGFAFSVYMLASKEVFRGQFSRVLYTFVKPKTHDRIRRISSLSYHTFSKYLSGYLVDSLIIGILCYIVMLIFGWPYPALISIIIGVFNMVPIFGPIIGAIPSILLIFLINPWQALFFGVFVIILQQIDGNFICPKILGQRIGIKPFWVMLAIVVGGSMFGIIGMLISVPTFAVIYSLARDYLDKKYNQKLESENK